jgi:hypothetical protein
VRSAHADHDPGYAKEADMKTQTLEQLDQVVRIEQVLADMVRDTIPVVQDRAVREHLTDMARRHDRHVRDMLALEGVYPSRSHEMDSSLHYMYERMETTRAEGAPRALRQLADFERAQSGRIQAAMSTDLDPKAEAVLDEAQVDIERDVLPLLRFTPGENPGNQPIR